MLVLLCMVSVHHPPASRIALFLTVSTSNIDGVSQHCFVFNIDIWIDRWIDGWVDGCMEGWMEGWMDGRMDGWMDGWMDTQVDRQIGGKRNKQIDK